MGGGDDAGMGREEGLGRERREESTNQINTNERREHWICKNTVFILHDPIFDTMKMKMFFIEILLDGNTMY